MLYSTLSREGKWYRGNTHLHTTKSDGEKTPAEAVELYRNAGYDFLALTDHNRWGDIAGLGDENFLVLQGTEIDSMYNGEIHHVVGIARNADKIPADFRVKAEEHRGLHPQELVNYLLDRNAIAIYAHPFWSYADFSLLASLKGLTGMEICNFSCEQEWKSGIAETYYEYMWRDSAESLPLWCVGSDDAHGHVPDFRGGYISVKAKDLTTASILSAIEAGSFTASYAPLFSDVSPAPFLYDFVVEDGVAKVDCSPALRVCINATATSRRQPFYHPAHGTKEAPVTHHEFAIPADTKFVRATVVGFDGGITWSQPIVLG